MTAKKKGTQFDVTFDMTMTVSIPIVAESMEEAITVARTYKAHDVVEIPREGYIDANCEVVGVYRG